MTRRRTHTRKGFNLIEAAIVLGVVGFVIGGIWTAYSSYKTTSIANQTFDGLLRIHQLLAPIMTADVLAQNPIATSFAVQYQYGTTMRAVIEGKVDGFAFGGNSIGLIGTPGFYTPIGNMTGYPSILALERYDNGMYGAYPIMLYITEVPKSVCLKITARARAMMNQDRQATTLRGILFRDNNRIFQGVYYHKLYNNSYRYDAGACTVDRNVLELFFAPARR